MRPLFGIVTAALAALTFVTPARPSGCVVTYKAPVYHQPAYHNYAQPAYHAPAYYPPSYIPVATYYPVPYPLFVTNYKRYEDQPVERRSEPAEGRRNQQDVLDAIGRVGSKMDLVLLRVDDLDRRVRAVESAKPVTPPTAPPPTAPPPPAPKPTDPFNPGKAPVPHKAPKAESVPQMFHQHCGACHDAKEAGKALTTRDGTPVGYKGGNFVMFVTTHDAAGTAVAAEMARRKGDAAEPLAPADLKKMFDRMRKLAGDEKVMPPAHGHDGTAIAAIPADQKSAMLRWLDEKIPK